MFELALKRQQVGLTQAKLAQEAGVSLPTVQNLEAGRGNPTLEVLEKLAMVLGVNLVWKTPSIDWEEGARLGIPLLSHKEVTFALPQPDHLIKFLRCVYQNWENATFQERETQALGALLIALKQHYPAFYRERIQSNVAKEILVRTMNDPKVIKLRRMALARIAEYL